MFRGSGGGRAMGGDTRMLFGTMNKQRKRNTQLQIEAIEEYLLGMYAEGWTDGEAGD